MSQIEVPWVVIRWKVLERDGFKCTVCGATENLHIHHKIARRLGGTDDLGNLTTLCGSHHKVVENETNCAMRAIETTTVSKAHSKYTGLKTPIPATYTRELELNAGDKIGWELDKDEKGKYLKLRKIVGAEVKKA